MSRLKLLTLYSLFAAIATALNLAAQEISLYLYKDSLALLFAVVAGTLTGLMTKFYLDKLYIFSHIDQSHKDSVATFGLYSFTGLFTTALFWAFEFGFEAYFDSHQARVSGAVIGLALGYAIKYQLDKRYVFTVREKQ